MMHTVNQLVLVACALVVSGCATLFEEPYKLAHGPKTWERTKSCPAQEGVCACKREKAEDLMSDSDRSLFRTHIDGDPCSKEVLKRELAYYPSLRDSSISAGDDGALPLLGLTLSGGGARSASTSIGFLGALDAKGILAQVDLISSVSGGSYASYWFFSHLYNAREELDLVRDKDNAGHEGRYSALFTDDGRFQKSVARHSHLATKNQAEPALWFELLGEGVPWVPMIPVHWITAGLFDRKENLNPATYYYHSGIERAYGLYPVGGNNPPKPFANDAPMHVLGVPSYAAIDPSMEEVKAFLDAQKPGDLPPFWIVNATAVYGGKTKMFREASWGGFSPDLRDTVYEFTPIHYGSPRLGYCPYAQFNKNPNEHQTEDKAYPICNPVNESWLKYGRMIGASGAAVDGVSPTVNVLLDVFNAAIGRYIDNPRVDDSVRQIHAWLPFPFYGLHRANHDEASPKIYLTDGGHSENLGLYALIKRRVKNIIVLDAEYEGDSYDKGMSRHKNAVFGGLQELRCRLYVEHGLYLMIARYGKDPVSEPFFGVVQEGERATEPCVGRSREQLGFGVQDEAFPYLAGWVCLNGHMNCVEDERNRLNILYVKLAIGAHVKNQQGQWDPTCIGGGRYNCLVEKYFHDNPRHFPHDSTGDIFYSEEKYTAYRDLGFDLGKCIKLAENRRPLLDQNRRGCEPVP